MRKTIKWHKISLYNDIRLLFVQIWAQVLKYFSFSHMDDNILPGGNLVAKYNHFIKFCEFYRNNRNFDYFIVQMRQMWCAVQCCADRNAIPYRCPTTATPPPLPLQATLLLQFIFYFVIKWDSIEGREKERETEWVSSDVFGFLLETPLLLKSPRLVPSISQQYVTEPLMLTLSTACSLPLRGCHSYIRWDTKTTSKRPKRPDLLP